MLKKACLLLPLSLVLCGTASAEGMSHGNGYMHAESSHDHHGPVGSVYHRQKVVYHVDEATKFKLVLGNVQNHINAFSTLHEDLEIIVLANGEGYGFLLNEGNSLGYANPWIAKVQSLIDQGVYFEMCNNTMKAYNIQPTDLLPGVHIVPAGVATLTELQMRGYAYLKP
ncbi:MAG TPA: DsrE family protein [Fibrobacteria bacterium]|nr:DsrE family protein [Fibrobacteria bacterium]